MEKRRIGVQKINLFFSSSKGLIIQNIWVYFEIIQTLGSSLQRKRKRTSVLSSEILTSTLSLNPTPNFQSSAMLLQPTTVKPPPNCHHHHHNHSFTNVLSFSSGIVQNSTFSVKQLCKSTSYKTHGNTLFITCSSISQVHSYGTVDYESRPMLNWNGVYKKISMMENPNLGAASVLNKVENEGKKLTKWELCRVVKELRKYRRFKYALEVIFHLEIFGFYDEINASRG